MRSGFKNIALSMSLIFSAGVMATAAEKRTPRGPDIGALAGHCSVGPFGQVHSAGEYDAICGQLSTGEICFAYIKSHVQQDGRVQNAYDTAKATFCSKALLHRLTAK